MKKDFKIVEEISPLEVEVVLNNTALLSSKNGKSGLYNTKTKSFVGELGEYRNYYSSYNKLIWQIGENEVGKSTIRIYDVLNEKMIIDGWDFVKDMGVGNLILESPSGKLHLFNGNSYAKDKKLVELPFDNINKVGFLAHINYFEITKGGKKGVCINYNGKSYLTPVDSDSIDVKNDTIIMIKENKKSFVNHNFDSNRSEWFAEINFDERNPKFMKCSNGSRMSLYFDKFVKPVLQGNYEDICYMYDIGQDLFIFLVQLNGKFGLVEVAPNVASEKPKIKVLLDAKYDSISMGEKPHTYFVENGNKVGMFMYDNSMKNKHTFVEPQYNHIEYIFNNLFIFTHENGCDVGRLGEKPIVESCSIKNVKVGGMLKKHAVGLYEKDGKSGMINFRYGENFYGYDNITQIDGYFIIEKDGKKGLFFEGDEIIPIEYSDIKVSLENSDVRGHIAVKNKDGYKLAEFNKLRHELTWDEKIYNDINFYRDIFVVKQGTNMFIFNYDEKLLMERSSKDVVLEVASSTSLYTINGAYYQYIEGKLIESVVESNKYFVTTYETEDGVYEAKTLARYESDNLDSAMEFMNDERAQEYLDKLSKSRSNLNKEYPKMTLKKINNKRRMS